MTTKSELAAQKCADLNKKTNQNTFWTPDCFLDEHSFAHVTFRRFVEHVSDLCEYAITSGDTSGLDELVLREPVDPLEAEADALMQKWHSASVTPPSPREYFLFALRRGREIERGEGR